MNRTARLLVAVSAVGLALTGCATGLTEGDRGAAPASVVRGADSGTTVDIPASTSPAPASVETPEAETESQDPVGDLPGGVSVGPDGVSAPGVSVGPDGVSAPGVSVGPDGVSAPGVSVGPDGVSAPGVSVGEDGVSAPGVSVGPDGVAVDPSALDEAAGGSSVERACQPGEHVTVSLPGSSVHLTGECASITVTANGAYVEAEGAGALSVSGIGNSITIQSHTSMEISGNNNHIDFDGEGPAPVDTGIGNTLAG